MKIPGLLCILFILLISCDKDEINIEKNKFMERWQVTKVSGFIFQTEL